MGSGLEIVKLLEWPNRLGVGGVLVFVVVVVVIRAAIGRLVLTCDVVADRDRFETLALRARDFDFVFDWERESGWVGSRGTPWGV